MIIIRKDFVNAAFWKNMSKYFLCIILHYLFLAAWKMVRSYAWVLEIEWLPRRIAKSLPVRTKAGRLRSKCSRHSKIQKFNIVRQHIRIWQRIPLCLPGGVFFNLKDMSIDPCDLHWDITQMELWLGDGNIDADFRITSVSLQNALPDLFKLIIIAHYTHAFYHKPAWLPSGGFGVSWSIRLRQLCRCTACVLGQAQNRRSVRFPR